MFSPEVIDHEAWVGPLYKVGGLHGQRVAIVGYSHHRAAEEEDKNDFTRMVVVGVVGGKRLSFFTSISNAFAAEDGPAFWNRVVFFNYLPDCVGTDEERYKPGTPHQIERAKMRFLKIIGETEPQKVIVFSTKAWPMLPPTIEEDRGAPLQSLGPYLPDIHWGTYRTLTGAVVYAFGVRHPQGAPAAPLRAAVDRILAMPVFIRN
jgi:hypothetical protein